MPMTPEEKKTWGKFGTQEIRRQFEEADVILGVHQHGQDVFWGRKILEQIQKTGNDGTYTVLSIPFDYGEDSTELECLCAITKHVKGGCDYTDRKKNLEKALGDYIRRQISDRPIFTTDGKPMPKEPLIELVNRIEAETNTEEDWAYFNHLLAEMFGWEDEDDDVVILEPLPRST